VDVCQNCLRIVREERQPRDPDRGRSDVTVRESKWSRRKDTTEIAYGPADSPAEAKGVFCSCGVEGSFVRIWDSEDVDHDRFRALLKRLVRSLKHKGVTVDRKATVTHALQARRDGAGVDDALAEGVRYGLARAEISTRQQTDRRPA
jgi:hypothetical protein